MQFSVLENGTGFLLLGILSQNVFNTPDNTWKSLQKLTCNPDIAVLKGDKDSSVVTIPRTSYNEKLQEMINDGITDGKYRRTSDNTTQDLQSFQSFLYRNFKNCKNENFDYDKVRPTSNKPAVLFATAKTHKFAEFKDITTENLKLRPIISTCGTYYYQSAKSLAKYLAPLAENEYTIKDTLESPDRLQDRTLDEDEVLVSYDVSSLFTEVSLEDTIDYIIHQIYNENKLPHLSNKRIFKRLLQKVTQGSVFSFNGNLYKQIDGCGMAGQSVVACDCKHLHVQTRTRRGHSSSPAVLRPVC